MRDAPSESMIRTGVPSTLFAAAWADGHSAVDHPDGTVEAPHLEVSVLARGLLQRVATRLYFPDEPANDADPVLASIDDTAVRATLVARPQDGGLGFDVHLQGPGETAFFAL